MKHAPTLDYYSPSHPWYYKLGGKPLYPKQIQAEAIRSSINGYRSEEINAAHQQGEPRRSSKLRNIREEVLSDLRRDLSGYREAAFALHAERLNQPVGQRTICSSAHVAVSLKYSHLSNDFAHLKQLESLLNVQPDLFD